MQVFSRGLWCRWSKDGCCTFWSCFRQVFYRLLWSCWLLRGPRYRWCCLLIFIRLQIWFISWREWCPLILVNLHEDWGTLLGWIWLVLILFLWIGLVLWTWSWCWTCWRWGCLFGPFFNPRLLFFFLFFSWRDLHFQVSWRCWKYLLASVLLSFYVHAIPMTIFPVTSFFSPIPASVSGNCF